ncbi:MAG TPA: glycosyltransferase [Roseiflexaceae bacterium]|nr:glycosyltransferase [Roseiflexaceae bacterium]
MAPRLRERIAVLRGLAALPRQLGRRPRPADAPLRVRFAYAEMGAPTRYRVHHHVEQALAAGLSAEAVPLDDHKRCYDLSACDLLYIHRLPLMSSSVPLLAAARLLRLPVVFDSDDLVWDEREREYSFLERRYDARTVARLVRAARRTRAVMRGADALVLSTPYLAARAARDLGRPALVHPNALSRELVALAALAYEERRAKPADERPVIGYFCGTPLVHDEDLASIGEGLCAALESHPQARLRIYGELRLGGPLAAPAYAGRIEQRPAVDWRELPRHITMVDINIAPLVDNPQRRGKSAVKYLEAAAVGVPTVAARMEPYQDDIAHGETGLLAADAAEWAACLGRLLASPAERHRMGEAARAAVLARSTTDALAGRFAALLARVARGAGAAPARNAGP